MRDQSNPPVDRESLTHLYVTYVELGKPVWFPEKEGEPQGELIAVQAEEGRKSEGWPVMGQIEILSHAKAG